MQCAVCKTGTFVEETTTLTFEKDGAVVVLRGVPARVCDQCGEVFVDEGNARKALDLARHELAKGIQVKVMRFAA